MTEYIEDVRFSSVGMPAVELVGRLHLPAPEGRWPAVVLCHPQPLVSDMDDPLLVQLAHALTEARLAALRFNFRGVAPSQGDSTDGRLEPLDVGGAVSWLAARPDIDAERIALVGHAFGAYVALAYADVDPRVRTIVAVSPPMYRLTPQFVATLDRPRLFVIAEDDEVCPRYKLEPWLARQPGTRGLSVIGGAQHLMRGSERAAAAPIISYLTRWSQSAGATHIM
jgi:uncharacterized protein